MQISRMDLADLGSPETLVEGILKQVPDMSIPVPIEDIARSVDITDIAPIGATGFEGGLITDRDKSEGVILVNRESHRLRQRFTVVWIQVLQLPEHSHELFFFVRGVRVLPDKVGDADAEMLSEPKQQLDRGVTALAGFQLPDMRLGGVHSVGEVLKGPAFSNPKLFQPGATEGHADHLHSNCRSGRRILPAV